MKEEKIPRVEFQHEQWQPLKAQKPYSENFCHIITEHENIWYYCYWTKRGEKRGIEFLTELDFTICWN